MTPPVHRCRTQCGGGQHVTLGYQSRRGFTGRSWFAMVGETAVIDGVPVRVVSVREALDAPPSRVDPHSQALYVTWKPLVS